MDKKSLWDASKVFAPNFPRMSTDAQKHQDWRGSRGDFVAALESAGYNGMPGYFSVYSFPHGHPKEGQIPKIDSIFIDLDVANHHYDPKADPPKTDFEAWRADMSSLLARARMIGKAIIEDGQEAHFRVVLSGHKGIHLYLDFPEVDTANGDKRQFKNGLKAYGKNVMEWLDQMAGGVNIDPWVDVDASDLARLARHPNTPHHGAAYDDTQRWCVAVTVEELSTMTVDDYLTLTRQPRPLPDGYERVPSQVAHDKLVQKIRTAASAFGSGGSTRQMKSKRMALKEYKNEIQNDDITLDDVLFLTKDKPCFQAFREREDAYQHDEASRTMELSIMGRLIAMGVPVDVMHEFFEVIPGYDEQITNDELSDLMARGNQYGEFRCVTICGGNGPDGHVPGKAPQFCLGDDCSIYRRSSDLQKND